jgi:TM2 domain-containing membrane protein YozV
MFCTRCGANNLDTNQVCTSCGSTLPLRGKTGQSPQSGSVPPPSYHQPSGQQQPQSPYPGYQGYPQPNYGGSAMTSQNWQALGADKKVTAGVLAILIGSLGVHKFILGYKTEGLIMLLGTLLTCGIAAAVFGIIGLIEGILYLVKSDEEFVRTYIQNRKGWF